MKDTKNNISVCKAINYSLKTAMKACPGVFLFMVGVSLVDGISSALKVLFAQRFFDETVAAVNKQGTINNALIMLGALCIIIIIDTVTNGLGNFVNLTLVFEKFKGKIRKEFNEKSSKIAAINYEKPEVLDAINKGEEGIEGLSILAILSLSLITFYLPYFLFMGVYLYKQSPVLALLIVIIFIPLALAQFIRARVSFDLEEKVAPNKRKYNYYEKCIMDREYFKETRHLGAFSYFKNLYCRVTDLINSDIWAAEKKSGIIELSMVGLTFLGYIGILALLVYSLLKGNITVGAFGAILASMGDLFDYMEEVVCYQLSDIAEGVGASKHLIRFMEIEERKGEDCNLLGAPDINIVNAFFRYPNAEEDSLKNINLNINPKETIAIVGENGAGKSTLVKLIMGIYEPSKGDVLISGENTKRLSKKSLYENTSAVIQRFQKYKLTLGENINISDKESAYDEKKLDEAVKKSGLAMDNNTFTEGYDTLLASEFDGIDLSGGQWQRVAIARGFYKNHSMIVLDEPTAAIDPLEETKLYKKFSEISKGKTSVLVTHRLGSAKIAHRIVVMDKGKIVQLGTHDELISVKGKYAEMYEAQGKWYSD